jgi:CheY-like chemotaxis protein
VTERGQRRRVLVIEDEVIVGMLLEDMLEELGCVVAAISTHIEEALQLARALDIDLAILDINLGGKQSFPVADVLKSRGVPFMFATGYALRRSGATECQVPAQTGCSDQNTPCWPKRPL